MRELIRLVKEEIKKEKANQREQTVVVTICCLLSPSPFLSLLSQA